MFEDFKVVADQIGWSWTVVLAVLVMANKFGILNMKIGGKDDVAAIRSDVHELKVQVARIETLLKGEL